MAETENGAEYRFHIDAFNPETIPLERLAEYLGYIARIIGEKESVHFIRLEAGSTTPVLRVDREAIPKVRERLHLVRAGEGPVDSKNAVHELNKRLAQDNANGALIDPSNSKVLRFPGRDAAIHIEFGPISEHGVFEGIPIRVGGERQNVPIHLEDGEKTHIIYAPRRLAIGIALHLFESPVRVEGKGKWMRNRMGEWIMQSFMAESYESLRTDNFARSISRLQDLPAQWKEREDPLRELSQIRDGEVPA